MLVALLLAAILAVSAMHPDIQELQFSTQIRQNEHCVICYGSDCLNIDENRCEYYRQTENILRDGKENVQAEDTEVRDRTDGYIMEYVHQDSWTETVCIPLVSYYTNCNRENVCTGCITCNCDVEGRWNCTAMQPCESTASVDLNHITLGEVMKKLKNFKYVLKGLKRKRSVTYNDGAQKEQMNYEDILELLYGIQSFEHNHKRNTTEKIITSSNINRRDNYIDSNIWDTESIRFEELLDSIDDDQNNNILNLHSLPHATLLNESDININTETSNNRRNLIKNNDIFDVKSVEMPTFDYVNNFDKTRNLTKRAVILEPKQALNNTSILSHNSSTSIRELENNVLYPLFNIVNEKRKELEQLINIKDKLVIYFKSFTVINITNDTTDISDKKVNPHLYFYQLEMPAESRDDNMRKQNQNILEKYMKKLKRDIFEVIRDISNIQRLSNSSAMPQNLKVLIRALEYYVNKEKQSNKITEPKLPAIVNLRKEFDADSYSKQSHPIIVFNNIFDSLVIYKDVSLTKALDPVSKGGKQILKRIIEQLYRKNIISIGSKALYPQHDIINLLNDIGNRWNKVITTVIKNSSSDRLYCMKLLNVEVLADIKKIKLALELLQIAENRRILLNDDGVGNRIISKIENYLKRISHLVKQIPHLQVLNRYVNKNTSKGKLNILSDSSGNSPLTKNKTRKSFSQTIRKLLRSSKKDIRDLFHRNVPKSDIIKRIAKKKIDEMNKKKLLDYEETMQRWQNNLNIRNKRSPGEIRNFFNCLKNIIPGYLRGKVKPAVHKKSYKTVGVGRKHFHQGHKKNKKMKLTLTTPTMFMHR